MVRTINLEREREYIKIGFCCPKYYKPNAWAKAKRRMEKLVDRGIVYRYDYGRGKGKYSTDYTIDQVVEIHLNLLKEGAL
jgi:hypothetical protein